MVKLLVMGVRPTVFFVFFPPAYQLPDVVESLETKVAEEGDGVDLREVGEQEDAGGGGQLALRASHQAHRHPGEVSLAASWCQTVNYPRVDVVLIKQLNCLYWSGQFINKVGEVIKSFIFLNDEDL